MLYLLTSPDRYQEKAVVKETPPYPLARKLSPFWCSMDRFGQIEDHQK
jgi:hypothetical protein